MTCQSMVLFEHSVLILSLPKVVLLLRLYKQLKTTEDPRLTEDEAGMAAQNLQHVIAF